MSATQVQKAPPAIKFEFLNWVGSEAMPYDKEQSQRLHEPLYRTNTTDPMTGNDIKVGTGSPSLVDGNLTVYFESKESRNAYKDMPLNHPNLHLPFPAANDDDRGG